MEEKLPKWKIQIILRNKDKRDRIVFIKNSSEEDPENAWTSVFSEWLGRHKSLVVSGVGNRGLRIKNPSGEISELIVDYKRISPKYDKGI